MPSQLMPHLRYRLCLVYCIVLLAFFGEAHAQEQKPLDRLWNSRLLTEDLYVQLNRHWSHNPVGKLLLDIIFISPIIPPSPDSDISWHAYQGKVIGKICLHQLRVFGPKIEDSPIKKSWKKLGNFLFPPTKSWVIRRQLYFHAGDTVGESQLKSSLKSLKAHPYLQQVQLSITPQADDIVDVAVVTQDKFPIQAGIDPEKKLLEIKHQNLGGLGHTWINYFSYDQRFGYGFTYQIPTLLGSAITGELSYLNTRKRQLKSIAVFQKFTQHAGYAGAADVGYRGRLEPRFLAGKDTITLTSYSSHEQNIWLGKSWQPQDSDKDGLFYTTARVYHQAFVKRPHVKQKRNQIFHNHSFMLGSWGFAHQHDYKAHFVYDVGQAENIPEGFKYNLIGGYQVGEFWNRPYAGLDIAQAKLIPNWGYLATNLNLGGFLGKQTIEQAAIKLSANYFSPIFNTQQYAMRQFISLNCLVGFNRFTGELLSMDNRQVTEEWLDPFPPGTKRVHLHLENVWWPSRLIAGCKIAISGYLNAVALYNGSQVVQQSSFCESLGLGLRVGHERFAFGTLQINLGYKPILHAMEFSISTPINLSSEALKIAEPGMIEYRYY
jgi:hypothetical protein